MQQLTIAGVPMSGAFSASFVTDAVDVGQFRKYLFELVWTGSPTGTITIEGSIDNVSSNFVAVTSPAALTYDPSSGSPVQLGEIDPCFQYVRLRWVRSGGTMTVTTAGVMVQ